LGKFLRSRRTTSTENRLEKRLQSRLRAGKRC
jgi:hypothetical protein